MIALTPTQAMFGRKAPEINVVQISWDEPKANWQDDEIHIVSMNE